MTVNKTRLHEMLAQQDDFDNNLWDMAEELEQHHHKFANKMMATHANELLEEYDEAIPYDLEVTTTQQDGHVRVQSKQDLHDYKNFACSQQAIEGCYMGTEGYDLDELRSLIETQIVRVAADAIDTWENHYLGQ